MCLDWRLYRDWVGYAPDGGTAFAPCLLGDGMSIDPLVALSESLMAGIWGLPVLNRILHAVRSNLSIGSFDLAIGRGTADILNTVRENVPSGDGLKVV